MRYILLKTNPSGAYPPIMTSARSICPEGCAIIPDKMDISEFTACGGFVQLTEENGIITGITGKPEEFEAWKNSNIPEVPEDNGTMTAEAALALLLSEDDE